MSADNFLEIERAAYITFEAVMQTLDLEVKNQIQSIKTISNSVDTSVASKRINFNKSGNKGIFMGVYVTQIHYANTNSFKLTINEITEKGEVGEKFFLTLHSRFAEEWQNNPTVKSFTNKMGNALIIFQNIPYQVKSQTIEFHLMTPSVACPWMKVKHYFSSFADAKSEQYVYTPLYDAEKHMASTKKQKMKCNLYAVIHSIIYKPKEGRQGKGQGMFVIVDPSCYEDMVKQREYCVHVFTSSLSTFPKIEIGDIIRLHRGWAEIRPRDGLPDFRVFREDDLVIFPWNDEERPRCSANRFTFTKDDVELVKHLKTWSIERYRKPVETQQANTEATDKNPITLNEIKLGENFNLSCRVVEFFEEGRGVAIWVEDGTRCPLITVSDEDIGPYESQETQDINSDCFRICVRCSKLLLGNLNLERQMLLFLREVKPVVEPFPNIAVVQFEIIGAIELLPLNTRYHISLMKRLAKAKVSIENIEQNIQPTEKMDDQTEIQQPSNQEQQVDLQPCREDPFDDIESLPLSTRYHKSLMQRLGKAEVSIEDIEQNIQQTEKMDVQTQKPSNQEQIVDLQPSREDPFNKEPTETNTEEKNSDRIPPQLQKDNVVESSEEKTISQKDNMWSGDSSTERAMKNIQIDCLFPTSKSQQLVREDFERESQRLHLLIHPELKESEANLNDSEFISRFRSQNVASLEDMHFSQAVASTQKPPRLETEVDESNKVDHSCISASEEIPNAQRILSPAESESSAGSNNSELLSLSGSPIIDLQLESRSRSASRSLSPHPAFRAVNEVLEIKTNCRSKTNDFSVFENENQLNTSIDAPLFRAHLGKGDQTTVSTKTKKIQRKQVVERVTFGDGDREEIVLIASEIQEQKSTVQKRNCSKVLEQPTDKVRRISIESCSTDSIIEIEPDFLCQEMDQESDKESVIILDPLSQDLEKIFCAVEEAQLAKKYLYNLEDKHTIQPGERFKITARIGGLFPKPHFSSADDPVGLKGLLVAFCLECKHLWQYNQFIDSTSNRVMQRRTLPPTSTTQDDGSDYIVLNYLCSKEEHTRNMRLLVEGNPDLDAYEFDEFVSLDKGYHYICPFCDSRKIPHSLCTLKPSFFLRMHVTEKVNSTEKSGENSDGEPSKECLHVLATGVHAEYFLGTKADHVLRSPEIWKRAEQRIKKLLECQQPLTLGLIRRASNPNEICLEFTKTIFAANHVLPWR